MPLLYFAQSDPVNRVSPATSNYKTVAYVEMFTYLNNLA